MVRVMMAILITSQLALAQWIQLGVNTGLPGNSEKIWSIGMIGERFIIESDTNGLYISEDNGDSWRKPTGIEPPDITNLIVRINNRLIAGSGAPGQGVFISDDQGENWSVVDNGLVQNGNIFSTRMLAVVNGNVFLSGSGLFRSTDEGNSWQRVTNGLPVAGDPNGLTAIDSIYFCTWSSGNIIRTSTDGYNWQNIVSNGLPNNAILREIIAINTTLLVVVQNQGIYRSTDFGANWDRITGINGNDQVTYDLFIHNNVAYAATGMFVYMSADDGMTWSEVDANFPKPTGMTILSANSSTLLAGQATTLSGQLWKHTLSPTGIDDYRGITAKQFRLEQNYPNPFNPSTTISYTIPRAGNVTLKIYDVLGKEITTLVKEFQNAGSYTVNFEDQDLSSGFYLYTLQSGKHQVIKKMLLIK